MTDRTRSAYDQWARTYDTSPNPHTFLEFVDVLATLDPQPDETILDAACGTGRYTSVLAERVARVAGLDFSSKMLRIASERSPDVDFRIGDLRERLPFTDAAFDAVLCAQALKHIAALGPTMSEFARVLRPGGRVVFSVTHPDMSWDGYDVRERGAFVLDEHADIWHHRMVDYLEAIRAAGLFLECTVTVVVSERIRHMLTEQSFRVVAGRAQILIVRARRARDGGRGR